jgi:hypothetical protein
MFAHGTSILISDKNYDHFKESFSRALTYLSKWFRAIQLLLNVLNEFYSLDKYFELNKDQYSLYYFIIN